jgi:ParB family transcriptional regulator, chromosome partitioning protein
VNEIRQILVNQIQVKNRIRKDYGDIDALAESIKKLGLIQPVTLTPDLVLIAGERRLMAVKSLGQVTIEAKIMPVEDYEHQLNCEIEENEQRKEFTPSERLEFGRQLEQVERLKAEEREKAGKKIDPLIPGSEGKGNSRDIIAKKVGLGSGGTYQRLKTVVDSGNKELIEKVDKKEIGIKTAYDIIKKKEDKPVEKAPDKQIEVKKKSESLLDSEEVKEALRSIINIPNFESSVDHFLDEVSTLQFSSESIKLLSKEEQSRIARNVFEVESWLNGMKKLFREAKINVNL